MEDISIIPEPYSCVRDFVSDYMDCDQKIDPERKDKAINSFLQTLGWKQIPVNKIKEIVKKNVNELAIGNIFLILMPVIVSIIIILVVLAITGKMDWLSCFLSIVFVLIVGYVSSVIYLEAFKAKLNKIDKASDELSRVIEETVETYIVKAPQAILAMMCAYSGNCTMEKPCWSCNSNEPRKI